MKPAAVIVIGGGAAGLMAAIWAGRSGAPGEVIVLDGARMLGAKILVSGGGRCNVTHDQVDETAFAGSTRPAIRKLLGRFDVPRTIEFFRALGVKLKREETGKLFPEGDSARTVLDALLRAAREAGVDIRTGWRVRAVERRGGEFLVGGDKGELAARCVVLATGGMSLPKTGSDGYGYSIARSLGHTITDRILPALVPLTLPAGHFVCTLTGLTVPARLEVQAGSGRRLAAFTGSTLCTHFGLSGPAVLDISRYYLDAVLGDPAARLVINWLPEVDAAALDEALRALGRATPAGYLRRRLPDRLADALCREAGIDGGTAGARLTRQDRAALVGAVTAMPLPITGSRGFKVAEVTAGGVPLRELELATMESRCCHGLFVCGEICDVDGRIGGYNFQWAWASGFTAGVGAARAAAAAVQRSAAPYDPTRVRGGAR